MGYEVEIPDISEKADYMLLPVVERADVKAGLIRRHLDNITASDAILVINKEKNGVDNYIGGNTLMEMAFAYAQNIEIFLQNPVPEVSYKDEIEGMKPLVLAGNIVGVDTYFKSLPVTLVSSKSPVKLTAISRGLRRAGIRTQVVAKPIQSGVSEQPKSIDETYEGAQNRHAALIKESPREKPDYFATVESGNHVAHANHNYFGCTVVILERANDGQKVGINLDLEIPKEMIDKVPSKYPDLGILVQQEYGSALKDPFPFFTNGKINRQKLVEDAVFNVAVQFIQKP